MHVFGSLDDFHLMCIRPFLTKKGKEVPTKKAGSKSKEAEATEKKVILKKRLNYSISVVKLHRDLKVQFSVGDEVFAQWKSNDKWYAGKIEEVKRNGKYKVRYTDDGDSGTVHESRIAHFEGDNFHYILGCEMYVRGKLGIVKCPISLIPFHSEV